mmetsp:Transcript_64131/g.198609  ORF Transcript_64131/g.198609 Transcript_64131/m.198609 type:complete len:287 (-) Transcript_64131:271-1131(-)
MVVLLTVGRPRPMDPSAVLDVGLEIAHRGQAYAPQLLAIRVRHAHLGLVNDVDCRDARERWRKEPLLLDPVRLHSEQLPAVSRFHSKLLVEALVDDVLPGVTLGHHLAQLLPMGKDPSVRAALLDHRQQTLAPSVILRAQSHSHHDDMSFQHARFHDQARLPLDLDLHPDLLERLGLALAELRDIHAVRGQIPGEVRSVHRDVASGAARSCDAQIPRATAPGSRLKQGGSVRDLNNLRPRVEVVGLRSRRNGTVPPYPKGHVLKDAEVHLGRCQQVNAAVPRTRLR